MIRDELTGETVTESTSLPAIRARFADLVRSFTSTQQERPRWYAVWAIMHSGDAPARLRLADFKAGKFLPDARPVELALDERCNF